MTTKRLNLKRPLVFLDIESTGLDTSMDRIVELALLKITPENEYIEKCYRYNPGISIPKSATEIHGITDAMVHNYPAFHQHAKGIVAFLDGCDIAGFNSNYFDLPMLYSELTRAGVDWDWKKHKLVDVGNIFKIKEQRNLSAALKFYCGKELENAHSAAADVKATAEVFMDQLLKYEDLPGEIEALALFSNYDMPMLDMKGCFAMDKEGNVLLNFGKYKGEKAALHIDFLEWMVNKANFSKDTVEVAMSIINNSK